MWPMILLCIRKNKKNGHLECWTEKATNQREKKKLFGIYLQGWLMMMMVGFSFVFCFPIWQRGRKFLWKCCRDPGRWPSWPNALCGQRWKEQDWWMMVYRTLILAINRDRLKVTDRIGSGSPLSNTTFLPNRSTTPFLSPPSPTGCRRRRPNR